MNIKFRYQILALEIKNLSIQTEQRDIKLCDKCNKMDFISSIKNIFDGNNFNWSRKKFSSLILYKYK